MPTSDNLLNKRHSVIDTPLGLPDVTMECQSYGFGPPGFSCEFREKTSTSDAEREIDRLVEAMRHEGSSYNVTNTYNSTNLCNIPTSGP